VLHLAALGTELGYALTFHDWDRIGRETPLIAKFKPAAAASLSDLGRAGGVPALLNTLSPLLDLSTRTVYGMTLAQAVASAPVLRPDIIWPTGEPARAVRG